MWLSEFSIDETYTASLNWLNIYQKNVNKKESLVDIDFSDGFLYLAGQTEIEDVPSSTIEDYNGPKAYIAKVDLSGNMIWSREYGEAVDTESFFHDIELKCGAVYGLGACWDLVSDPEIPNTPVVKNIDIYRNKTNLQGAVANGDCHIPIQFEFDQVFPPINLVNASASNLSIPPVLKPTMEEPLIATPECCSEAPICCSPSEEVFCEISQLNTDIITTDCYAELLFSALNDCQQVTVDWGDGTIEGPHTMPHNFMHNYTSSGTYVVCIRVVEYDQYGNVCYEKEYCMDEMVECDTCCSPNEEAFCNIAEDYQINTDDCYAELFFPALDDCHQVTIDWGDGTIDGPHTMPHNFMYNYTTSGSYVICVFVVEYDADGNICYEKSYCHDEMVECDTCCSPNEEAFCEIAENYQVNTDDCYAELSFPALNDCQQVTIDWGDGTIDGPHNMPHNFMHNYTTSGTYTVCITVIEYHANGNICYEKAYCLEEMVECPCEPDCDLLQVNLVNIGGADSCCYQVDVLNNHCNPIVSLEAEVITSGWQFNTATININTGWNGVPFANKIKIDHNSGTYPLGSISNLFDFCLVSNTLNPPPNQSIKFTWYEIVGNDTLAICDTLHTTQCEIEPPTPCVEIINSNIECESLNSNIYKFTFQVRNNDPTETATNMLLSHLTNNYKFRKTPTGSDLDNIVLPTSIPPNGTSGIICVYIYSPTPISTPRNVYFNYGVWNKNFCCHAYEPFCVQLDPCYCLLTSNFDFVCVPDSSKYRLTFDVTNQSNISPAATGLVITVKNSGNPPITLSPSGGLFDWANNPLPYGQTRTITTCVDPFPITDPNLILEYALHHGTFPWSPDLCCTDIPLDTIPIPMCCDSLELATTCENFNDLTPNNTYGASIGDWRTHKANVGLFSNGCDGTPYIRAKDASGGSYLYNNSATYAGDWLDKGCELCFDLDFMATNNTCPNTRVYALMIYTGTTSPNTATVNNRARFILNTPITVGSGCHQVCMPIDVCSNGSLPNNSNGSWWVNTGAGVNCTDFDNLIQNVSGIAFAVDNGCGYQDEVWGFDNFCFNSCECCPPTDTTLLMSQYRTAMTCGVDTSSATPKYTFGVMDNSKVLPVGTRTNFTGNALVSDFHHPSWRIDSIGNVFGITIDQEGYMYAAASANYGAGFWIYTSLLQYGNIGGGANDLAAAGTIYQMDRFTGQASFFAQLPQQQFNFTHENCEGIQTFNRDTGPGLGNIVYDPTHNQIFAANWEDGRIYRLDMNGNRLDSYDPQQLDNNAPGLPSFANDVVPYGLAVTEDGSQLFFGTLYDGGQIYSINLTSTGGFVGTLSGTDNYVGTEQLHYDFTRANISVSDLEFLPDGNLLVGTRSGCNDNFSTSYSQHGSSYILTSTGGIYNSTPTQLPVSYDSNLPFNGLQGDDQYGGVAYAEYTNDSWEYVVSSSDILAETGPHGIAVIPQNFTGSPISQLAGIAYAPITNNSDMKGIGGDVQVFNPCSPFVKPTKPDCCQSEMDFENRVDAGFTSTVLVNTTTVTPNNLTDCHTVTWIWGDGTPNGISQGNATTMHTYAGSGNHSICMVVEEYKADGDFCWERESCDMIVSASSNDATVDFKVYPNPAKDYLTFEWKNVAAKSYQLAIFDLQGRIIWEQSGVANLEQKLEVDVKNFPTGMYGYHLQWEGGQAEYGKFIKGL